ncbi:hypothetical protein MWU59_01535 [Flavobacteriaceae bacterium F08102]|nr:hypothetical protein [Flavobacteriaceae bacterium F08102]
MWKGIAILLVVFVVVAILHIVAMKSLSISSERKKKLRKLFWYLYGMMFLVLGLVNQLEKGSFSLLNTGQMIIGGVILMLNYFNKIETDPTR